MTDDILEDRLVRMFDAVESAPVDDRRSSASWTLAQSRRRGWIAVAAVATAAAIAVAVLVVVGPLSGTSHRGTTPTHRPTPTTVPTVETSVPVVQCPTEWAILTQPSTIPVPKTEQLPLPVELVGQLNVYTDSQNLVRVLGPKNWTCAADFGADGSGGLGLYPKSEGIPSGSSFPALTPPASDEAIVATETGGSPVQAAAQACPYFPGAVTATEADLGHMCAAPSPREEIRPINEYSVGFKDPPGATGGGVPSGGPFEAQGVVTYDPANSPGSYIATCTLPTTDANICDAVIVDFVRSYGSPSSPGPSQTGMTWSQPVSILRNTALTAVSCSSQSFCVAADQAGAALTFDGRTWSAAVDIDPGAVINDVSCSPDELCVAVDNRGRAAAFRSGSWSSARTVDTTVFPQLTSVSCPSSSFCMATDGNGNVVTYDGVAWSSPQRITEAGWTSSMPGDPTVSCASPAFCVVLDLYDNANYFVGGAWVGAGANIYPATTVGSSNWPNPIACVSADFCVATEGFGYVLQYDGRLWSMPLDIDGSNYIRAVSCPSHSLCVAVDGRLQPGFGGGTGSGNVEVFNGTSWSSPGDIDGSNVVVGVSCPSDQFCLAVDQSGNAIVGRSQS